MSKPASSTRPQARPPGPPTAGRHPWRRTFVVAESAIAASALLGTVMLLTGTAVPDVGQLSSLGLHSWVLPGLWLAASVAVPSAAAAWAAVVRWPGTPAVVLVASALLLVELGVQVPFLGFDPLQVIMGVSAVGLAALAWHARRQGWVAPRSR